MNQANKDTFFLYFIKKTGGRHEPALLVKMIEALKEWLPESTEDDDSWAYTPDYYNGQGDYKQFLVRNLK